jgi:hypothetical protein
MLEKTAAYSFTKDLTAANEMEEGILTVNTEVL